MTKVLCIGQAVQDFVFSVDTMPRAAEKYRARAFESIGGGPAATAAVAIARLGGSAQLAARMGDDAIADVVRNELDSFGVDCSLVRQFPNRTSSLSAVFIDDDGERLIVNYMDPALEATADWLPDRLSDDIDAVLVDTHWPEGALHGLQLARQRGVPGVVDADLPVPADGKLVGAATHVAFSLVGLADYCSNPDPEQALLSVGKTTEAWCCVTLGSDGIMYLDDDEVRIIPAYAVEVGDTLGAGDVWHGAFALALGERQSIASATGFANAAAALKVANGGGRNGSPSRKEVDRFLQVHGDEGYE